MLLILFLVGANSGDKVTFILSSFKFVDLLSAGAITQGKGESDTNLAAF